MKINKLERVTTRRKSFQKFNTKFEREKKILAKGKEVFKRKDFWKRNFKCLLLKSNKVFDENQIKILECHTQDLRCEAEDGGGQYAACGGALISKIANAPWPKGSFPEVSGLWQREWFYITAPRSAKWVAAPAFRSGPPPQLMSWISRGPSWGPVKDVPILQGRIREIGRAHV